MNWNDVWFNTFGSIMLENGKDNSYSCNMYNSVEQFKELCLVALFLQYIHYTALKITPSLKIYFIKTHQNFILHILAVVSYQNWNKNSQIYHKSFSKMSFWQLPDAIFELLYGFVHTTLWDIIAIFKHNGPKCIKSYIIPIYSLTPLPPY